MSQGGDGEPQPRPELVVAFDRLLERVWTEHQALVAQLRRLVMLEETLVDLCRCAGVDVAPAKGMPDVPELEGAPETGGTLHNRWDGAFEVEVE